LVSGVESRHAARYMPLMVHGNVREATVFSRSSDRPDHSFAVGSLKAVPNGYAILEEMRLRLPRPDSCIGALLSGNPLFRDVLAIGL